MTQFVWWRNEKSFFIHKIEERKMKQISYARKILYESFGLFHRKLKLRYSHSPPKEKHKRSGDKNFPERRILSVNVEPFDWSHVKNSVANLRLCSSMFWQVFDISCVKKHTQVKGVKSLLRISCKFYHKNLKTSWHVKCFDLAIVSLIKSQRPV